MDREPGQGARRAITFLYFYVLLQLSKRKVLLVTFNMDVAIGPQVLVVYEGDEESKGHTGSILTRRQNTTAIQGTTKALPVVFQCHAVVSIPGARQGYNCCLKRRA